MTFSNQEKTCAAISQVTGLSKKNVNQNPETTRLILGFQVFDGTCILCNYM